MTLVECENCGETFEPKWGNSPSRRRRFCGQSCASKFNARQRPRRTITSKGYVAIHAPEHPSASKQGYVMEHRLVVEETIGRLLTKDEVVHHRNGRKDDNRPSNLEVMPKRLHDRKAKKPPHLLPCPHCAETIWVQDGTNHAVGRVTLHLPPSRQ